MADDRTDRAGLGTWGRRGPVPRLLGPAALLVGAGAYSLAEGPGGLTFFATPLAVGLIAVVAGLFGRDARIVPSGIGLAGWGAAVALVHGQVIPAARTAPADMVGAAVGILAASALAPADGRGPWARSAAVAVLVGGVGYYLAFGQAWLARWPAWALSLVAWAAWVALARLPGWPLRRSADLGAPESG